MKILFYGYGNHAKRIKKVLDEYIYIPKSYCFINKSKKKDNWLAKAKSSNAIHEL